MPLKSSVKTAVVKKLEEYEGRYDHMYLDTKSKVTIGVGHLIATKSAVSSITMYTVKDNLPSTLASLKQKQEEYDNIAKQKKNYKASWYKKHTKLVMKKTDIDKQRDKHIDTFYKELTNVYKKTNGYASDFDGMPENVQKALFDMIFNLGQTKLKNTFTKFNDAVKKEKWADAAKESNRPDVNSARNTYVKGLFNGVKSKAGATSAEKE